jgi:hypothetical protein
MALNFPASPSNGQLYSDPVSGNRWMYTSIYGVWRAANEASGGADLSYTGLNSNTTISQAGNYIVNTANGPVYLTMPSTDIGSVVIVADGGGDKTTNNIIIRTLSGTVNNSNTDFYIDVPNTIVNFIYTEYEDWKVFI